MKKLHIPRLKARLIFRRLDGHRLLDLPNAAWWPDEEIHALFSANTPRCLLLFFSPSPEATEANLYARSVNLQQISGHHRYVQQGESHPITGPIGSIQVQLLTETECPLQEILKFEDDGDGFPKFFRT